MWAREPITNRKKSTGKSNAGNAGRLCLHTASGISLQRTPSVQSRTHHTATTPRRRCLSTLAVNHVVILNSVSLSNITSRRRSIERQGHGRALLIPKTESGSGAGVGRGRWEGRAAQLLQHSSQPTITPSPASHVARNDGDSGETASCCY